MQCCRDRVILAVRVGTGLRLSDLCALEMSKLREERLRVVDCIVFRSVVGAMDGQSKPEQFGLRAVGDRSRLFLIPDEIVLRGRANFYGTVDEYLKVRSSISTDSN